MYSYRSMKTIHVKEFKKMLHNRRLRPFSVKVGQLFMHYSLTINYVHNQPLQLKNHYTHDPTYHHFKMIIHVLFFWGVAKITRALFLQKSGIKCQPLNFCDYTHQLLIFCHYTRMKLQMYVGPGDLIRAVFQELNRVMQN